ncbi:hypothetical protein C8R44DRAFT_882543 [Mycena epipterygia]|nr:hypothetical protein C8R44DRAFT_882543 [Mycena epipterygia]
MFLITHHLAQRANTPFYNAITDMRAEGGHSDEVLALLRSMSLKQNELIERSDRLERRNAELESLLTEPTVGPLPRSSSSSRGGIPSRATFTQLKKRRKGTRARVPETLEVHDSDIEDPEQEVVHSTLASGSPSIYLGAPELTGELKRARDTLQNTVTRVSLRYLNPVFGATVAHPINHNFFLEVAKQVTTELHDTSYWPDGLSVKDTDEIAAENLKKNLRTARWKGRRITKVGQLGKAIDAFAKKHGLEAADV